MSTDEKSLEQVLWDSANERDAPDHGGSSLYELCPGPYFL